MNRKTLALLFLTALVLSLMVPLHAQEEVTITVRAFAVPPHEDWRCNGFAEVLDEVNAALEAEGDSRQVVLELICDNPGWDSYKTEFTLASDAGEAPDIWVAGHEDIGTHSQSGNIIPLTDLIMDADGNYLYPEFEDVIPNLWNSAGYAGDIWAIPQDAEARPLYFSKTLLSELGWSAEDIDALPAQIQAGEFTWDDMIATAQEAIAAGVVDEGHGIWHRPTNGPDFLYYYYGFGGELEAEDGSLYFDTEPALKVYQLFNTLTQETGVTREDMLGTLEWSEWHATMAEGTNVLFSPGGTWNFGNWAANYHPSTQDDPWQWLFDNIGYALVPAFEAGSDPITLTHPLVYTVSSSSEYPDLAVRLIAAVTTPEINTLHAVESAHLGVLKSQADYAPYADDFFLSDVLYMLDYTTYISNSPFFTNWSNAYYTGIQAVEAGDLSPEEAVEFVAEMMSNEIGDGVTIR